MSVTSPHSKELPGASDLIGTEGNTQEVLRHIKEFNAKGLFPMGGIDDPTKRNLVKLSAEKVATLLTMAEAHVGEVQNISAWVNKGALKHMPKELPVVIAAMLREFSEKNGAITEDARQLLAQLPPDKVKTILGAAEAKGSEIKDVSGWVSKAARKHLPAAQVLPGATSSVWYAGGPVGTATGVVQGFKKKLCTNFLAGECRFGENCTFAHGEDEIIQSGGSDV